MVLEDKNEILKITCGNVLRFLINSGISSDNLWPVDVHPKAYSEFPAQSQNDRHWNNSFQSYIDDQLVDIDLSPEYVSQIPHSDSF